MEEEGGLQFLHCLSVNNNLMTDLELYANKLMGIAQESIRGIVLSQVVINSFQVNTILETVDNVTYLVNKREMC